MKTKRTSPARKDAAAKAGTAAKDAIAGTAEKLFARIDGYREDALELEREMTRRIALGPENGGTGEKEKADWIEKRLKAWKFPAPRRFEAPDPRVPSGTRPSLVSILPGADRSRTLWIMAHLDVIPSGDRGLWKSDPFTLRVEGDRLYGRGVEDNQQGACAGILAMRALIESGTVPAQDLGLVLAADEETGSAFGLEWLLDHTDLFRALDQAIVPDAGDPKGNAIEIAEKSGVWYRFRVRGKQCHASRPSQGLNAHLAGCRLALELDKKLKARFARENPIFEPPSSTFECTKREANVPNVNTIPGEDVFYLDARILPEIPLARIDRAVEAVCAKIAKATGAKISFDHVHRAEAAPPTDGKSGVVRALERGIRQVHGRKARHIGIGGGTVAACFRNRGIPAAVFATLLETAHQPDECCLLSNLIADAKIFARAALEPV